MKKCIIIPAYNEQKSIFQVIRKIKNLSDADLIVINDGSADETAIISGQAGADVVINHPFNLGYGVALQTGYKYAHKNEYDCLVQMDADGQHDPACINDLFAALNAYGSNIVIGSRFLNGNYEAGALKIIAIRFFNRLIKLLTGEKITDPTSGFQALDRKAFAFFTRDSFPYDYPDANVIILLHRIGFKIREIPVRMLPNPEGRGMHNGISKILYYFFKVLLSIFITIIQKKELLEK